MKQLRILIWGLVVVLLMINLAPAAQAKTELEQTSQAFKDVAKKALDAVVFINVETTVDVPYQQIDPFEFFFGRPGRTPDSSQGRKFSQMGQGSGFIISEDGYILTNNHVVNDADRIEVTLSDDRKFEAELIGTDPESEVALIKIKGEGFPCISLGDSDALAVGEWVIAAGNPFGLSQTVTAGIVSAKGRNHVGIASYENFIQTDAAINPGNSGGPLLNIKGEVVGINTAIYSRSGGYMGIGFAIPINMALKIKNQLLENGTVQRSFLGVAGEDLDEEMAPFFDLKSGQGIVVSEVIPDTAAEEAGLKRGDILLELNGWGITSYYEFRNRVATLPPGSELTIKAFRDGKELMITATTRVRDTEELADGKPVTSDKLGFTVLDLDEGTAGRLGVDLDDGVLIASVEQGSPASRAGLQRGLLIRSVNRKEIHSAKAFQKVIRKAAKNDKILLLISDGRSSRFVVVALDK